MKKSKSLKGSCSSSVLNECSSHPIESGSCLCNVRFKELDSFLSNLELEEHKRVLLQAVKNVKTISDSGGKGLVSHSRRQDIPACPFDSCPVLHYEGLWRSLSNAFIKKGCLPDEGNKKSSAAVKQKVSRNLKPGVKTKKVKTYGSKVVPSKTSVFEHNTPVDKMLQAYRDNNIYSKVHMRCVDEVAITNAIQSLNYKQTPIPAFVLEPQLEMPRVTCAQVVNISFHRDFHSPNELGLKYYGSKKMLEHQKPSKVKPGTASRTLQPFDLAVKQLFSSSGKNFRK